MRNTVSGNALCGMSSRRVQILFSTDFVRLCCWCPRPEHFTLKPVGMFLRMPVEEEVFENGGERYQLNALPLLYGLRW